MPLPTIALDIDDTLSLTKEYLITFLANNYNISTNLDPQSFLKRYKNPEDHPNWQSHNIQSTIAHTYNDPAFLNKIPPRLIAQKYLTKFGTSIKISCYISSRLDCHTSLTKKWLMRHRFPNASVILRQPHIKKHDWKLTSLAQQHLQTHYLIDDHLLNLQSQTIASYPKALWYNPYQIIQDSGTIKVFNHWKQIYKFLKDHPKMP